MPRRPAFRPTLAIGCAVLMAVLLLIGAVAWYRPAVTTPGQPIAEVPAPPALFVASRFALPAHEQACMRSVTITPQSQEAQFELFPTGHSTHGPPVQFTANGPGYRATASLKGGYPGGVATLPLSPPGHALIGAVCFHNLGSRTVLLVGSSESRTVSRSYPITIAGRTVDGDVALTFLQNRHVSIVHQFTQMAQHASNLTDGLLPPFLIWIVAVLTALGVPAAMILAVYAAFRDLDPGAPDEDRLTGSRPRTAPSG